MMDAQAQQPQEQQQASTKVFTVVETRHLLKILMNPKTLAMFKDNKQSHSFVWNYIFKCMKLKFPKFAKSTRQCYKKYVGRMIECPLKIICYDFFRNFQQFQTNRIQYLFY